jgi:nucleotide-binding universal stress UspA family protein
MTFEAPILVCYDGSDGARAALDTAVIAFHGPLVVACYWQPFGESQKRFGIDLLEMVQDPASINEREQALAQGIAEEGAARVEAAGGTAEPVAIKVSTPVDQAILTHADELDALAIVLGSRSRSAISSVLLGDVASVIVQLSNRPVFVVPSTKLVDRRNAGRTWDAGTTD